MVPDKSRDNNRMATASNLMLRASIVLGMVAAVVTILYFTPLPDQNFKSCDRPCHALDWPMICRVKLNIEMYQTTSQVCENCPNNSSNCTNMLCGRTEDSTRGIIIANRQLPGPPIQVCHNDILVVDVVNKVPGHSIAMHWRGQANREAPFMDGVPMVTQCPITSYTTFQYKFRASSPGTHFYHAHSDSDRTDGLFGALIIRQADKIEPHRKLYDVDSNDHVVLMSEWSGDVSSGPDDETDVPRAILINGKAPLLPMHRFNVEKGKRYRFRLAYTGGKLGCPITVSVERHLMKVIALDGNPVAPYEVNSVELAKGERLDFVLKTNQKVGTYLLKARSSCNGNTLVGASEVVYDGFNKGMVTVGGTDAVEGDLRNFDTSLCSSKIGKVCLGDVRSLNKIPQELKEYEVDRRIYLGFDYRLSALEAPVASNGGIKNVRSRIHRINNFTFTYPSSPLLTQPGDIHLNIVCNDLNVPEKCIGQRICECVHLEHIRLGATTEVILIDQGGEQDEHIFHLHGYHFYVVGSNTLDGPLSREDVKKLDTENKLLKRNLANPVIKDTIRIPKYGVVALRFVAKNPGFWMLRDEQSNGWTRGMDIVFQVGGLGDVAVLPTNFPTCGSYIGPDFFLL